MPTGSGDYCYHNFSLFCFLSRSFNVEWTCWNVLIRSPVETFFVHVVSSSDHGPSRRSDSQPRRAVGRPAERSLGGPACSQGLPVPGQIPDPLQAGGQPGLEGKKRTGGQEHKSATPTVRIITSAAPQLFLILMVKSPLIWPDWGLLCSSASGRGRLLIRREARKK